MADTSKQPTVLVKKSDGTEVRMTLEEFKKMRGLGGKTQDPSTKIQTEEVKTSKATVLKENVPMRPASSQALATTAPVVDIFKDEAMASQPKTSLPVAPAPKVAQFRDQLKTVTKDVAGVGDEWTGPKSKPFDISQGKPMMSDIHPPERSTATMGPKEEMEAFNLVDFRRLAPRAKEAGTKLTGKFENWKQESFLLYREVIPAWRKSPLYHAYQQVIIDALRSDVKLHDAFAGVNPKEQMTEEEFGALVEVNKMLS